MGIALELVNFTELFNYKARGNPIIINTRSESSKEDKEELNKLIYTRYKTDLLSNLPACECGEIVGEHNVGVVCPKCTTQVTSPMDQELEPIAWMQAPIGVAALMNPIVWTMLKEKFTIGGFEVIRWLCDGGYRPTVKRPPALEGIMALDLPSGYNNFVNNFDMIMEKLFNCKAFKPKKGATNILYDLIKLQRDCIFSQYLPLPNRSLLVIEDSPAGAYLDPIIPGVVDAIRTMASIDSALSPHTVRVKENRTVKTIAQLANFYDDLYKNSLAEKEGIFRKHIYGTRSHFSFRAVISSSTDNHKYDEIYIPWGIGISVLRIHLVNKLFKLGYTPAGAVYFLNKHSQIYNPLLDTLFQELIAEAPGRGVSCILQRNPSLERASAQAMYITRVKTDPLIPTVSLSILSVVGYNAKIIGYSNRNI